MNHRKHKWILGLILVYGVVIGCNSKDDNEGKAGNDSTVTGLDTSSYEGKIVYYNRLVNEAPGDWNLLSQRSLIHYESGNAGTELIFQIYQFLFVEFLLLPVKNPVKMHSSSVN